MGRARHLPRVVLAPRAPRRSRLLRSRMPMNAKGQAVETSIGGTATTSSRPDQPGIASTRSPTPRTRAQPPSGRRGTSAPRVGCKLGETLLRHTKIQHAVQGAQNCRGVTAAATDPPEECVSRWRCRRRHRRRTRRATHRLHARRDCWHRSARRGTDTTP